MEHRANVLATTTREVKFSMFCDFIKVEYIVKSLFGKNTQLFVHGSQLKRTNVIGSDLDLKFDPPKPLNENDRCRLGKALDKVYGKGKVEKNHAKIHVIRGDHYSTDVVPTKATYFPPEFKVDKIGKNPFLHNPTARHAARNIKGDYGEDRISGSQIERAVLKVQRENKNIPLEELIEKTKKELNKDTEFRYYIIIFIAIFVLSCSSSSL